MDIDKETLLEVLRQLEILFPVIGVLAAFLLLLPTEVATLLGVHSLRADYIGFIVVAAAIGLLLWSFTRLKLFWGSWTAQKAVRDEMQFRGKFAQIRLRAAIGRCSTPERAILIYCLDNDQDVVFLRRSNPAAQMLCHRHIRQLANAQSASKGANDDLVPFAFQLYVFKALKEMGLELKQSHRAEMDLMVEQIGKTELDAFSSAV